MQHHVIVDDASDYMYFQPIIDNKIKEFICTKIQTFSKQQHHIHLYTCTYILHK